MLTPLLAGDCGGCRVGCYGSGVTEPFEEQARTRRLKAAPAGTGTTGRGNTPWGNRLICCGFGSWTIAPGLGWDSREDIRIPILSILSANPFRPQACKNTILSSPQLPPV